MSTASRLVCILAAVLIDSVGGSIALAQEGYQPLPPPVQVPRIEFTEQTLGNGLHVIYAPRAAGSGVVHVRVIYHVGSKNERPDRQGFAHLFEHMMFRGSAHVGTYDHMRLIDSVGGVCNAITSFDTTSYFETLPAEQLELALWLEADRMSSFEPDEASLLSERKIVAQEWAEKFDRPFGAVMDDFFWAAFKRSNYRWPPIGNMEHLRAARVEELKEFFHRWYVPNNATLVIAGDFDVAEAKAMVGRLFGWIARGTGDLNVANPPELETTRPMIFETSRPLPAPQEVIAVHTPRMADGDRQATLMAIAQLLKGTLVHYLVATPRPLASRLGVELMPLEDGGLLRIEAELPPGVTFQQLEDAIFVQTSLFHRGLTGKEVRRAADAVSVTRMLDRETTGEVARELGEAAVLCGSAKNADEQLAAMETLKVDDVDKATSEYFADVRATVLRVHPDASGAAAMQAVAATALRTARAPAAAGAVPGSAAPGGAATNPVLDSTARPVREFPPDYPIKPPIAASRPYHESERESVTTLDGAKVITLPDTRFPGVHWAMALPAAPGAEPLGKEGVARLTAMMMGPKPHSPYEPNPQRFLEVHGAQVGVWQMKDRTVIAGFAPNADSAKDVAEGVRRQLQDPVVLDPDLLEMFVRGPKIIYASELERRGRDPAYLAERELRRYLVPASSSTSGSSTTSPHRTGPTTRSVMSLTLADVAEYFKRAWRPQGAVLIFGGDVSPEQASAYAHTMLDNWKTAAATQPATQATSAAIGARSAATQPATQRTDVISAMRSPATQPTDAISAMRSPATQPTDGISAMRSPATQPTDEVELHRTRPRVIVINAPAALRATIRIGAPAYDATSPDRFAGAVAAHVLGSGVHSRLGTFIRTEKGYAYTVGASFVPTRSFGYFLASARTDTETAADAVATMLDVIGGMRPDRNDSVHPDRSGGGVRQDRNGGGVTEAELSAAKAFLAAQDRVQSEGAMQRVIRRLLREIGSASDDTETAPGDQRGDTLRKSLDEDAYDPRLQQVTAADVREVIEKYVRPEAMTVVIVAPAAQVVEKLKQIGDVKVIRASQVIREQE